ncbi:MAG: cysteine hydrolase family protein [Kurthia sp.]|nr:cysteine hydrolase family protein [Candidatus Kurthia equi]
MNKALLVIDYTNDFVASEGALTCGVAGQQLEPKIASLVEEFIAQQELVLFANDLHQLDDPYHPESKLFPPHNLKGSNGRNLYGSIQNVFEKYQNQPNVISMDKTRYSAFAGTPLQLILNERNISEVHLVGVCTDICILHTAVDAYNLGMHTVIYKNGVASFNPQGHDWALDHFQNSLGFDVK